MKETKRTVRYFKFYDRRGIQAYLEEMAEKGWLLTKCSDLFWHFKKIEPAKLHFSVVYFPQASMYEASASENQLQFQEFCAHTGWKLAASNAQLQFFYNEAETPVPIETDAVLEVENIHKSVKRQFLPGYYFELFLSVMLLTVLSIFCIRHPILFLPSGGFLVYLFCWTIVALLSLTEITKYFSWYKKARLSAEEENSFEEPRNHPEHFVFITPILLIGIGLYFSEKANGSFAFPLAFITAGITLVYAFLVTFLFFGTIHLLKKMGTRPEITKIGAFLASGLCGLLMFILLICWVFEPLFDGRYQRSKESKIEYKYDNKSFYAYQDSLPFTVSDLIDTDYTAYSRRLSEKNSFLLSYLEASERPRVDALAEPRLNYRILKVKVPFLYDFCLKHMLEDFAHNFGRPVPEISGWEQALSIDAAPWGANKAYELSLGDEPQNRFLLCYDKAIVEIDFEWEADANAIEKIKNTLEKILAN